MRILLMTILGLFCLTSVRGQSLAVEKKRRAQEFFAFGRFEEAKGILGSDRLLSREDKEGRFLLALCHYQLNELDRAALLLNDLIKEERTPYPECWLFMGKIFHARHQFEKASDYYKAYLKLMDKSEDKKQLIWDEIERCANGLALQYNEQRAFAENLGASVNTKFDEFAPIISPTRNDRLYFSSARQGSTGGARNAAGQLDDRFGSYLSDMYSCRLERGTWMDVAPMDYLLNSPQTDILLDIKFDGSVLYYFSGDKETGSIRTDTFSRGQERLLTSDLFPGPLDPRQGDLYPHFVNDTLIYFASNRPGGYGGYDLYKITRTRGHWSAPQNLGQDINTPYDEITPFQARDMRTLYFSTDHPALSIGGLDVVKSVYVPEINHWAPPQNLGLPINSAADDTHFRLSKDGFSGFLSSARKDGFGQRDIYAVFFQDFLEEMEPPEMAPIVAQASPVTDEPDALQLSPLPGPVVSEDPPSETTLFEPPPPVRLPPPLEVAERVEEPSSLPSPPPVNPSAAEAIAVSPPPAPVIAEESDLPLLITPILVEDGSTLDDADRRVLNALAAALLSQTGQQLVITTYSNQQLNRAQQINEGINLAEGVASYLFQQGVPFSLLFLRAALADLSRAPNQARIVAFNFTESEMMTKGSHKITLQNPWLDLTRNILHEDLVYKVQVAASKRNNFTDRILEEYVDPMIEKRPDFPYYRYTIGAFRTFRPAGQLRGELVQFGNKSAFPVPYVHGWRLEGSEIQRKITAYPDLRNYLGNNR